MYSDKQLLKPKKITNVNAGMPDDLKSGLENISGIDLSGVHVHYNSSKPKQINALAYTQGQEIYLGPGQDKYLPHEGWHVVQQMQGRVKPTMWVKGVMINDDASLEHEADVMGAKAVQMKRPVINDFTGAVPIDAGISSALSSESVIQRNVGIEIESSPYWQAYDKKFNAITNEHKVLYSTPDFRLETELSGKLEFIIEPPLNNIQELLKVMEKVVEVATAIEKAKAKIKKNVRDDFASDYYKKEIRKNVNLFKLNKVIDNGAEVYISKGSGAFQGGFQATVGVHLSAVPYLMERIAKGDFINNYPSWEQMKRAQKTGENARRNATAKPFTPYSGISPAMEGLLDLIYYYIFVGEPNFQKPFPKGITQIMARTNFGEMFLMTPEAKMFALHPELWVEYVTKAADISPNRKVFCGSFGDRKEDTTTVDVKIGDWLLNMTKNVDLLSTAGGGPPILKTMGNMTKTDDIGAKDAENRGVILELRGLDFSTIKINQWIQFAYDIAHIVEQLNSLNDDRLQAKSDVSDKDGNSMYLSQWNAEQEGGENILLMGIEAMNAPFKAQVAGLIIRARERATLAKKEVQFACGL